MEGFCQQEISRSGRCRLYVAINHKQVKYPSGTGYIQGKDRHSTVIKKLALRKLSNGFISTVDLCVWSECEVWYSG